LAAVFLLPLTHLDVGIDTRLLTPALLLPLLLRLGTVREALLRHDVALRLLPLCALAIASITWSGSPGNTSLAALALVTVVASLFLFPASIEHSALVLGMRWLMTAVILSSAVALLTPFGQLAGRARGILGNPNALATLLVLAIPLFMRGRWRVVLPIALALLLSTASRAGIVAVITGMSFYILAALTRRVALRALAALLAAVSLVAAVLRLDPASLTSNPLGQSSSEVSVLRFEHSREFEWHAAMEIWQSSPLIGNGFGASEIEIGSSFLKVLVDLGLLGLVTALPFLLFLAQRLMKSLDPRVVGTIAGGLVNSAFEGWLLTGGSAFFLMFCLMVQSEEDLANGHHDP